MFLKKFYSTYIFLILLYFYDLKHRNFLMNLTFSLTLQI